MSGFHSYLLSVLSAAVICAVLHQFFKEKNVVNAVIHLLAGVFLTVTVIRPILTVSFATVRHDVQQYSSDAAFVAQSGEKQANAFMKTFIKEQTEAYILDEAKRLHTDISVQVCLSDDDPPVPVEVTLIGAISPYTKAYLANFIAENIGVSKECQLWTG